jgi:hypothetical protein
MVREAFLPDQSSLRVRRLAKPIRKPAFDQLQRSFERDICGGREQQMQMIGHNRTHA